MFDNLRELSDGPSEFEEGQEGLFDIRIEESPDTPVFGMTTGQRFVLSILLLATVLVMGTTCLMVTGKVWYIF
ncbi:MAG: hypothetical protein GTO14_21070 [Anaerolineales bacterium]|nr:hypothetical protein [Anaerolineales bacterium]